MSKQKTLADRWASRLKNTWPIALLVGIGGSIIVLGQVSGAFTSMIDLGKSFGVFQTDPRVFKYKDQIIKFDGGNGNSIDSAIVIRGALTSDAGLAAEKYWVKRFYPDYKTTFQSVIGSKKNDAPQYDLLVLESEETGYKRELFFDITSFYGTPDSDIKSQRASEKIQLQINKVLAQHPEWKGQGKFRISIDGENVKVTAEAPN